MVVAAEVMVVREVVKVEVEKDLAEVVERALEEGDWALLGRHFLH